MVRAAYVSCWNASDVENAGLWNLYGGGVAVRSTFQKLKNCLQCPEPVFIGMVRYIDYRAETFDSSSGFHPLMHKRRHFEHEQELRAVIAGQRTEGVGDDWHWVEEDPRHGIVATVDLKELVDEIRVAPEDTVLAEVVPELVERYRLDARVEQSSLDDPPQF